METIGRKLQHLINTTGPTSQRAFVIQRVCDALFEGQQFKKVLGQTKEFTVEEIHSIFETANRWKKNPQAFFWKLVREKQKEIQLILQKAKR